MRHLYCFLFLFSFFLNPVVYGREIRSHIVTEDSLYEFSIKTLDGIDITLGRFKGKKILIVVLPVSLNDSSSVLISEFKSTQAAYRDSVVMIGVFSEDFGYSDVLKQQLKNIYGDQQPNYILADGEKVRKSSGLLQSILFQWLTDKNKNRHLNKNEVVLGDKFFIDERGELYGTIGGEIRLSHPLISRILSQRSK